MNAKCCQNKHGVTLKQRPVSKHPYISLSRNMVTLFQREISNISYSFVQTSSKFASSVTGSNVLRTYVEIYVE